MSAPRSLFPGLALTGLLLAASLLPATAAPELSANQQALRLSYQAEMKGNYTEALTQVKQVLARSPKHYFCQMRTGYLYMMLYRYADAMEAYQDAARLQPESVEAAIGALKAAMALGNWASAETWARAVLKRDAENYVGLSRLAYSFFARKEYASAAKYYDQVLGLYPSDLDMKNGLAWSWYYTGKKSDARRLFDEVLDVSPDNASAKEGLMACNK